MSLSFFVALLVAILFLLDFLKQTATTRSRKVSESADEEHQDSSRGARSGAITAALAIDRGHMVSSPNVEAMRASAGRLRFSSLPHQLVQVRPAILCVSILLEQQTKRLVAE